MSYEQAEKRQAKAVRFLRDVADDPDLADEIGALSVREYAERKGLQLNPTKRREQLPMKKEELQQIVKSAVSEALGAQRSNPTGGTGAQAPAAATPTEQTAEQKLAKVLDAVDDALTTIDEGDQDEGYNALVDVLDEYREQ